MKRNILKIVLVLNFLLIGITGLSAYENNLGTSGRVEIFMGTLTSNNNLIPLGTQNETIDSTDEKNTHTKFMFVPAFELAYQFKRNKKIYIASPFCDGYQRSKSEREGISLGVEQSFLNKSILDISIFAGGGFTWENPYVTGEERNETYYTNTGLNAEYKHILGTGLQAGAKIQAIHVDTDEIGKIEKDLKRDGLIQTFKSGYEFSINDSHFITPAITYSKGFFKGDSNDFDKYLAQMTYTLEMKRHTLSCKLEYFQTKFNTLHPIFNKKNNLENYSINTFYTKKNIFHMKGLYSTIYAGYHQFRSNIDFYDCESLKIGMSWGLQF